MFLICYAYINKNSYIISMTEIILESSYPVVMQSKHTMSRILLKKKFANWSSICQNFNQI